MSLNDSKPLVSVVIPTYNRAYCLKKSLNSVLKQSYQNLEVIVVDDASTDDTESTVLSIDDPRISYIKLPENKGANYARNVGIKASVGSFVAFQDSDDEWLCEKIEEQVSRFRQLDVSYGVIYTGFFRMNGNVVDYTPAHINSSSVFESLLGRNFITTQSILVKRKCFDDVGLFDESLRRFQDWEILIRLSKEYKFYGIDKPYVVAYHTDESISSNDDLLFGALSYIYKKHLSDIREFGKEAIFLEKLANACVVNGKFSEAISWYVKSLSIEPFRFRLYVLILASFFGKSVFKKVFRLGVVLSAKLAKR